MPLSAWRGAVAEESCYEADETERGDFDEASCFGRALFEGGWFGGHPKFLRCRNLSCAEGYGNEGRMGNHTFGGGSGVRSGLLARQGALIESAIAARCREAEDVQCDDAGVTCISVESDHRIRPIA